MTPRGGPGRGQGRKAIKPGESTRPVTIHLASSQSTKLKALGGAPWVREQIETASLPDSAGEDNRPTMGHHNEEIEMETRSPAAAQMSVDAAFAVAWNAARKNGAKLGYADESGVYRLIQLAAPAEYAEYERILRAARSALRGTKYDGSVTA